MNPQDLCHHNLYQTGINTFLRSRISDSWIYWNNILRTIILNKSGTYGALSKTCFQLSSAFHAAYTLLITRQQTDLSAEPLLCSLSHQEWTKRRAVSKGLSKNGAMLTVCRGKSRSNHELSKPGILTWQRLMFRSYGGPTHSYVTSPRDRSPQDPYLTSHRYSARPTWLPRPTAEPAPEALLTRS